MSVLLLSRELLSHVTEGTDFQNRKHMGNDTEATVFYKASAVRTDMRNVAARLFMSSHFSTWTEENV